MVEELYSIISRFVCCFVCYASCRFFTVVSLLSGVTSMSSPRIVTMMYKYEVLRLCHHPSRMKALILLNVCPMISHGSAEDPFYFI